MAQHESLCPPSVSQGTRGGLPVGTELEESSHHPHSSALPPSLPSSQRNPSHLFKKKSEFIPSPFKSNMSVIDEAAFFNFKGKKVCE